MKFKEGFFPENQSGGGVSSLLPAFTAGAIPFGHAANSSLTQDATKLFYDDTNDRLGIGTNAPAERLQVTSATTRSAMKFVTSGAAEFVVGSDGGISYVSTTDGTLALNANNTACWNIVSTGRLQAAADDSKLEFRAGQTQTTVGAAGAGDALPATPTGYLMVFIGATERVIPFYDKS